jgi:DNA-binding transcriptional ArsR family regulator
VLCVGSLASQLDVTQGAVSQHLRVMREAGLVIDEKRGHHVHYRLDEQTLDRWRKLIDKFLAPCPVVKCQCRQLPGGNRKG